MVADLEHVFHSSDAHTWLWWLVKAGLKIFKNDLLHFVMGGLGENGTILEWELVNLDTVVAMLLYIYGGFWWSDWAVLPNIIHIGFVEIHPFAIVDLE